MKFESEDYRQASVEHVAAAFDLYESRRYVLAHYTAGLSVECILRAYKMRIDPVIDTRHDLMELYRAAQFERVVPRDQQETIGVARGIVFAQWSNNQRFCSDAGLRAYFKRAALDRGIKGDFVKERARRIVSAAFDLVNVGTRQWNS